MFEDWDTIQPLTQDWFFLESPVKITIICTAYLFFIFYAGPEFMKNRPAYSLKSVIIGYNVFQIIASFYMAKEFLSNGVSFRDFYQCSAPDYSNSPKNMYLAKLGYFSLLIKLIELTETIFFVLRKKQKQISTLHIYHHISTVYIAYFGAKFVGCGLGCMCAVINFIVHFFMYLYYLLSSLGDENWKQNLQFYKKGITKLQIIQFLIIMTNAYVIIPCIDKITAIGAIIVFLDVVLLLYMFVKFYIKSYSAQSIGADKNK